MLQHTIGQHIDELGVTVLTHLCSINTIESLKPTGLMFLEYTLVSSTYVYVTWLTFLTRRSFPQTNQVVLIPELDHVFIFVTMTMNVTWYCLDNKLLTKELKVNLDIFFFFFYRLCFRIMDSWNNLWWTVTQDMSSSTGLTVIVIVGVFLCVVVRCSVFPAVDDCQFSICVKQRVAPAENCTAKRHRQQDVFCPS